MADEKNLNEEEEMTVTLTLDDDSGDRVRSS